jgi:DNA polymerase-3 subunit delta
MTALKTADIDAFVARPDKKFPIVLICGPDAGLVSERAEAIVRASVDDPADAFSVTKMAGDDIASDPAKLIDEAQAIPMFGGRRAIWIRSGARSFGSAVEAVLAAPPTDCRIVIEAGDLKKNAPLRALLERARNAAVLPCYADEGAGLVRLIDEEMRAAGLAIAPDARAALIPLIGGDRRASRNELKKLALYAHGQGKVTIEHVLEIVGDSSALALDALVDAAFAGRPRDVDVHFAKAIEAGTYPGVMIGTALRQVAQLHKMRMTVESGTPIATVVDHPQIFFRRRGAYESALKAWTAARLVAAMTELAAVALRIRQQPALGESHAHRALLQLATAGRGSP